MEPILRPEISVNNYQSKLHNFPDRPDVMNQVCYPRRSERNAVVFVVKLFEEASRSAIKCIKDNTSAQHYSFITIKVMTTWLVETCCLFDTFMVIKEYCCADVLSFIHLSLSQRGNEVNNVLFCGKEELKLAKNWQVILQLFISTTLLRHVLNMLPEP